MKLKHVLTLSFIFLSVLPLFLALQYLNEYTAKQHRTQVEEKLEALSFIAEKRIEAVIARIIDSNALIASRTQMRLSLVKWLELRDKLALQKVTQIIKDAKGGMTRLHNISIYDTQGNLVTSTLNQSLPTTLALPIKKALPLVKLNHTDEQLFVASLNRLMLDNHVIGYIETQFYADFVIELIQERTGLGKSGEWLFAVRNQDGDALFAVPLKYDSQAAFKRTVSKSNVQTPITQALMGNEVIMAHAPDYTGQAVLASTRYLPSLDWGIVVKMNEAEISESIKKTSIVIYLLEGIILVLAIAIGVSISVYISNPIEKLISHTNKVAKGNFDPYTNVSGLQEVKELSKHFNYMISALKDLNDNLNQKVLERTQELNSANQKLKELSIKDPLTGLFNRRHLHDVLSHELNRSTRYKSPLTLCIMDIDHFKTVNDTWGHDKGDEVLIKMAKYLQTTLRDCDTVARIGGEEFCIILPSTRVSASVGLLERIRQDISDINFDTCLEQFTVTASFGVTLCAGSKNNIDNILKQADLALYKAKSKGRNRVEVYSQSDDNNSVNS
ncbi:hypothetical protein PSECIP111854_00312 [Pseudoalteromonas sp. CIP111854]|uniref:diguanylate cyclase n=1 Tax=Pseudoalteromonas holothuriae TaxID=2963714 RepID=A0A9W4QR33_9GAMM|nr:diguanylate cyclase [Pseudoalteromonas sp. CIP111854]CAH9049665.1 hypothetical protein PSECIP111854_00312 [Pseudoalteromonas sp. CIP111854]